MKLFRHLALLSLVLLTACSAATEYPLEATSTPSADAPLDLTHLQQIGEVAFRSIEGYIVEQDIDGGIYIYSPDAEISIYMVYGPSDFFTPDLIPESIGGEFPEESIPVDVLVFLGFPNIQLQPIHRYRDGERAGYSRSFTASTDIGDPIEGEYLFYTVGENTFVAMGSVVYVTGQNRWDPQGKAAFDAVMGSVQFLPAQ